MDAELKAKMDDDLQRRLDRLYSMKMQPSLYLSQRFDSIINAIDFDAERIILDLQEGKNSKETKKDGTTTTDEDSSDEDETPSTSLEKVNKARCEFIRILRLLEKELTKSLPKEIKEPGRHFLCLEEQVKEFRNMQVSQESDINDAEEAYAELVTLIIKDTNQKEKALFQYQTIFFWSSWNQQKLGSLLHFKDLTLTNEQIDFLR